MTGDRVIYNEVLKAARQRDHQFSDEEFDEWWTDIVQSDASYVLEASIDEMAGNFVCALEDTEDVE